MGRFVGGETLLGFVHKTYTVNFKVRCGSFLLNNNHAERLRTITISKISCWGQLYSASLIINGLPYINYISDSENSPLCLPCVGIHNWLELSCHHDRINLILTVIYQLGHIDTPEVSTAIGRVTKFLPSETYIYGTTYIFHFCC